MEDQHLPKAREISPERPPPTIPAFFRSEMCVVRTPPFARSQPGHNSGVTSTRPKSTSPPTDGGHSEESLCIWPTSRLTKAHPPPSARGVKLPKPVLGDSKQMRNHSESRRGPSALPVPPGPRLAGATSRAPCPPRVHAPHASSGSRPGGQAPPCPELPRPGQ